MLAKDKDILIMAPVALGELIDKITVLKIKEERISFPERLVNVRRELGLLTTAKNEYFLKNGYPVEKISDLELQLKKFNEEIWDMGEKIRELGEKQNFGKEFVEVAYGIHLVNDQRAAVKKDINLIFGSSIVEEKSYQHWR